MTTTPDEFDAVRTVTKTLEAFSPEEQKLILRWAAEKLGITFSPTGAGEGRKVADAGQGSGEEKSAEGPMDIKSFTLAKNPKNDLQFAAVVAYYYRFEAKEDERKTSIKVADLIDASRKVNRQRPKRPDQTLLNTVNAGLLDKLGRGSFAINSVGENLVAVTLPGGGSEEPKRKNQPRKRPLPRKSNKQ